MRFYVAFALFVASFSVAAQVHAADDELFSEVAMETVFDQLNRNEADLASSEIALPKRMTGVASLMQLLKDAKFQPKQVEGRGVKVEIQHAQWKLPVYMRAEVDRDRLVIEMPLAKIEQKAKVDQSKLLKLLTVGTKEDGYYFTYNQDDGLIELRRVMDNRGFTPARIKQELSNIAKVAQKHEEAWSDLGKLTTSDVKPSAAKPTTPGATTPRISASTANLTLLGTWSATLGTGEAFAIELKRDATFQLVHVKAGKSVSSSGKATKSGSQLTLADTTGNKIVGSVSQTAPDAFSLTISGTTLNFKKAK